MNIKGVGPTKAATLLATLEIGNRCNRNLDTLNNLKLPDNLRSSFNIAFNELDKALNDF